MPQKFDLVVIGAGPGGYVAAIRAGQLGVKTAVVERDRVGGVCLNYGCIPSKSLIHASGLFEKIQHADAYGFLVGAPKVDGKKLQEWKSGIVKRLTTGVGFLLAKNGVTVIAGTATFTGKNSMSVKSADGKTDTIEFGKAIIATGARPVALPPFPVDGKVVMTSKEILDLDHVPENLVVIGGGVIGLEMGMVFLKLGSKLTVVELTDSLLPGVDPEAVKVLEKSLAKRGATVMKSTKAGGLVTEKGKTLRHGHGPRRRGREDRRRRRARGRRLQAEQQRHRARGGRRQDRRARLDHGGRAPSDERPPRLRDRRRGGPPLARAQGEQGGHRRGRARVGQAHRLRREGDALGHLHGSRDRDRRPPGARGEGEGRRRSASASSRSRRSARRSPSARRTAS